MKADPISTMDTGWHSFFTTMNAQPEESLYLIGDESQLEAKFSIHFRIKNPTAFFYDYAKNNDLISLLSESVFRELISTEKIDDVLTTFWAEHSEYAQPTAEANE